MARPITTLALALLVQCAPLKSADAPADLPPIVPPFIILHADVDFTQTERAEIADAIERLHRVPVDVDVRYDLDFGSTWSVMPHLVNHNLLVRITSDNPMLADRGDPTSETLGVVLGMDLADPDFGKPSRAYLVADLLSRPEWFEHVFEHEVLHVFGLRHVDDPDAIMFDQMTSSSGVDPTAADQLELRRVWCR